jgi:cytochrome c oxidase accessory protein FixG
MREQVCKYMCPYARFQSAMFDKDTLIVTYDVGRGEPRGARSRSADYKAKGLGECVDCTLCVQVCPTGIDIRNGLQYECIGCTACIDVCNGVMDKMKYPRGLVRYATQNGLKTHLSRGQMLRSVLRPRVVVYSTILIVLLAAVLGSLALRSPFRVDVVRDRSSLARIVDDGDIENLYRLQVMNSTERTQRYRVRAEGLAGLVISGRSELEVEPAQAQWLTVAVRVPAAAAQPLAPGAHPIRFEVQRLAGTTDDAPAQLTEKSTFVIPR